MVKELKINCTFPNGNSSEVRFYVGDSAKDSHPIKFQADWLKTQYGGKVSDEIMKSLQELKDVSEKNHVAFEELCDYVFKEVKNIREINDLRNRSNQQLKKIKQIDQFKDE